MSKKEKTVEVNVILVEEYKKLFGKRVIKIAVDTSEDEHVYGLVFHDETIAWILQDPEGNGPGFLQIDGKRKI